MEDKQDNANKTSLKAEFLEIIKEVIIVVAIVLFIRTFIFENTKVIGPSMEPTLHENNALIVNKFEYRFTKPERGEIIVFPYKGDPSKHYIKRIIGLPGEVIDIKNQTVFIDGKPLEEDYILERMEQRGDVGFPFAIPEDTYFVMGDNRNNSSDSRYQDVGTIEKSKIIGHAVFRIWPLNELGIVK